MAKVKLNYQRAREVARAAIEMKHSKRWPFDRQGLYPDAIIPSGMKLGDINHRLYMYYSSSLDAGRDSYIAYQAMLSFASQIPMTELPSLTREDFLELMKEPFASFGDPEKALGRPMESLYRNSQKMYIEYGNDPNNMLAKTPDETLENMMFGVNRKRKFLEVGIGKAALIMKNFVRFGVWPFSPYEIPIKIDRHIISISLGAGVIQVPRKMEVGRTEKVAKIIGDAYRQVCREDRISAVELNDAFWAIGRHLCKKNNGVVCATSCDLECSTRPKLSERASYYHPKHERREETDQLVLELD